MANWLDELFHIHKWGKWSLDNYIERISDKSRVGNVQMRQCETCGLKQFRKTYTV